MPDRPAHQCHPAREHHPVVSGGVQLGCAEEQRVDPCDLAGAADRLCGAVCPGLQLAALCKAERLPVWHGLLQRRVSGQCAGGRHLGQQRPAAQLHLPHPSARGDVVGGRELLSAGRKARFQRGDAGRPQGRAAENIHPPLHPGGCGGHGADGLSAAAARLFGPHRQEPEQLQHGCFHDPDRCHHRQQPDGQTLG